MRCFVPATDEEIYAYIERYGIAALVPYRVGVPVALHEEQLRSAVPTPWLDQEFPRRAA